MNILNDWENFIGSDFTLYLIVMALAIVGLLLVASVVSPKSRFFLSLFEKAQYPYEANEKAQYPYEANEYFFTKPEGIFYWNLMKAVGDTYIIFGQVRIADVLRVSGYQRSRSFLSHFNKISSKHFDYILCDKKLRIIAAIELDDSSHERKDRRKRDSFIEAICRVANLPLIRFKLRGSYSIKALQDEISFSVNQNKQHKRM